MSRRSSRASSEVVALEQEHDDGAATANAPPVELLDEHSPINSVAPATAADGGAAAPPDRYNLVYLGFWLLGAAYLAPWNSVLSVSTFWDVQISPGAIFTFTISYMTANLAGLGVLVMVGDRLSFAVRILPGLALFAVVLALLLFVDSVIIANVCMAVLGLADAIVQGSVWSLASQYNDRMTGAVMAGNGLAGILITAIQLIIFFAIPPSFTGFERDAVMIKFFFATSILVIVVSAGFFQFVLMRSPLTRFYLARASAPRSDGAEERLSVWRVTRAVAPQGFNAFLVFLVTLTLYPAIASLIPPTAYEFELVPFFVVLVAVFNLGDFVGRSLPRWIKFVPPRFLWLPVLARVAFVPVFVFCVEPRLIASDAATYIIVLIFALTNGYLGTLAMQYGPELVQPQDRERAGAVMVTMLTVGLTIGVWCGVAINAFAPGFMVM